MSARYPIQRANDTRLRAQITNVGSDLDQRVGKEVIAEGVELWIPSGYQMTLVGELTVLGELIVEGTLFLLNEIQPAVWG
jgi:hypothetical protein